MGNKSDEQVNARIGGLLQNAREFHRVTQQEMAQSIGLTKNHISKIERGQSKASIELLLGYCKKLDITPDELLGFYGGEIIPELRSALLHMDAAEQNKVLAMIRLMQS
jgi:transcriptional regulator with XRE-family HTH domain